MTIYLYFRSNLLTRDELALQHICNIFQKNTFNVYKTIKKMKNKKGVLIRMAIMIALVLGTLYSYSQPGKTNTNFRFDTTGLNIQPSEVLLGVKKAIPVDSGRILMLGSIAGATERKFLVRVDSTGHIDPTFGFPTGTNIGDITSFTVSKTFDTIALGVKHYPNGNVQTSSGIGVSVFNKNLKSEYYNMLFGPNLIDTNSTLLNLVASSYNKFYCSVDSKVLEVQSTSFEIGTAPSQVNYLDVLDDTVYIATNSNLLKAYNNFSSFQSFQVYPYKIDIFDFDIDSNLILSSFLNDTTTILKINRNGSVDTSFHTCVIWGGVSTLTVQKNNTVFIGGTINFTDSTGNFFQKYLYNIQANGFLDTCSLFNQNLGTGTNAQIDYSTLLPNGDILITGMFDILGIDTMVKTGILYKSNALDVIDTTCSGNIINAMLSLKNNSKKDKLFLYPNPATTVFYINFTSISNETNIDVFDSLGNNIQSNVYDAENLNENGIDIAGYPIGIYFVKIIVDGELYIKKLIVVE